MTSPMQPARYQFEYPDEAGYPDGTGTLTQDQQTLIDQVLDTEEKPDLDFNLVNDEENGIYEAVVGDTAILGITYNLTGDRIVLLAASVHPEFRHQGVATEMTRRVLDDVRAQREDNDDHLPDRAHLHRQPPTVRGPPRPEASRRQEPGSPMKIHGGRVFDP